MNMLPVLSFAHLLLEKAVKSGGFAIDATAGNGHDTVFLAKRVGEGGKVFAFDIQPEAVRRTKERLEKEGLVTRAELFCTGHEHASECIPAALHGKISGAVFNLGYLPDSDKTVITRPESTIAALEQIFSMLETGGIIAVVVYHGHEGGAYERDRLLDYVKQLDQKKAHVLRYEFLNQANHPPFLIAIEKR
ncbi:class I SAM-dependent methyltransferase [Weizmannia coagulans]|jgi:16S rRNA C1402 N4-methylase RsmH|uniref:rRNA methylase n=3 Tax=Heyndrickxia TaxID=2837504 RepID=A0A0C5C1Q3_HEYCO|nr:MULTISPECIES: class I SAM-dependent methyltransferase [Heyndrickxia]NWN94885.1 class I SAM-dependent methyltransferase [Bacillus sp. (in: firmicutes)]AEP01602.1 rRNA methylase [Heyndrickxia coagulans 36D1]AJO22153.1 rRNA methylase [Heyndrickxia coagulans]AKN56308.1 SAM-dependent methyltransferase, MraW methylase family [Heyndrickxia coagulans]APB36786.1 rRNA methyltransferase [Heyndrickxia coagulans]